MGIINTATPRASLDLPLILLRLDMIEPGDVLLTRGVGSGSKTIASLSGGEFSHAALVVNLGMVFESDGGIIGYKAIRWLGSGMIEHKRESLGHLLTDPKRLEVYRHPGLRNLPAGTFDAALRAELEHSYGRDYSELYRLVALAKLNDWLLEKLPAWLVAKLPDSLKAGLAKLSDWLKRPVAIAFKLRDNMTVARKIPGPFCSELVSRVFEHMGLALFEHGRPAAEISPNHLAESNLVRVEGAIISSSCIVGYKADEGWDAEQLYPATGDPVARYRRGQRGLKRDLDTLNETLRSIKEQSRGQPPLIAAGFQQLMETAFQTLQEGQVTANEGVTRWAQRICNDCIVLAPELAALNVENPDSINAVLLKHDELCASIVRCLVISKSLLLRRAVATCNSPIRRFRIRRARRKILRAARESSRSRLRHHALLARVIR